jgi:hypothetical protein
MPQIKSELIFKKLDLKGWRFQKNFCEWVFLNPLDEAVKKLKMNAFTLYMHGKSKLSL